VLVPVPVPVPVPDAVPVDAGALAPELADELGLVLGVGDPESDGEGLVWVDAGELDEPVGEVLLPGFW
jgi:hypothetical protein